MGRLDSKVALISGGARGQGAAEAARFVAEGARVVVGDVLSDECASVVDAINAEHPGCALAVDLDVTDPAAWEAAVAATLSAFGGLHVLVNNAGIASATGGPMPLVDLPLDAWRKVIEINLTGNFIGIQVAAAAMLESIEAARSNDPTTTGSIVNISSAQGIKPSMGNAAYASSKWGQRGLTKVAALELAPLVRVNSVHPGPIDTPMIRPMLEADTGVLAKLIDDVPLNRVGTTEDVANLVLFLASDESGYCNGSEFVIEGGRVLA